jgi:hypothetical protein
MENDYDWGHYYGRGAAETATPEELRRAIVNVASSGWSEDAQRGYCDAIREHLGEPESENRPWWRFW